MISRGDTLRQAAHVLLALEELRGYVGPAVVQEETLAAIAKALDGPPGRTIRTDILDLMDRVQQARDVEEMAARDRRKFRPRRASKYPSRR